MTVLERNVHLCDRCEAECGSGIVDAGDRACNVCGQHEAPHEYVPLADARGAVVALDEVREVFERYERAGVGQRDDLRADVLAALRRALAGGQ